MQKSSNFWLIFAKNSIYCKIVDKRFNSMEDRQIEEMAYVGNVFYRLGDTARVSELMARNYYKSYITGHEEMLEIDEFKILSHILENPDLSQSDISKLVYKGKAHVGKILNEMAKKGYIKRVLSKKNNINVKHTVLTDYGLKLYKNTDCKYREIAKHTLKTFSKEEVDTLILLLDKLKLKMLETNKIYF